MLLSLFFSSALIACQHCYKPLIVGTIQGESAVFVDGLGQGVGTLVAFF
jgi:hypothetical protein